MTTEVANTYILRRSGWALGSSLGNDVITSVASWPCTPEYDSEPRESTSRLKMHTAFGTRDGRMYVFRIDLHLEAEHSPKTASMSEETLLNIVDRPETVARGQPFTVTLICPALELGWVLYLCGEVLYAHDMSTELSLGEDRFVVRPDVADFALCCEYPRSRMVVLTRRNHVLLYSVSGDEDPDELKPIAAYVMDEPCLTVRLASHLIVVSGARYHHFLKYDDAQGKLVAVYQKTNGLDGGERPGATVLFLPQYDAVTGGGAIAGAAVQAEHRDIFLLQSSGHPYFKYKLCGVNSHTTVYDARRVVYLLSGRTAPRALHSVGPYIFAVMERGIDIYHAEAQRLMQSIDIRAESNTFFGEHTQERVVASFPVMMDADPTPSYLFNDLSVFSSSGQLMKYILLISNLGTLVVVELKNLMRVQRSVADKRRTRVANMFRLYNLAFEACSPRHMSTPPVSNISFGANASIFSSGEGAVAAIAKRQTTANPGFVASTHQRWQSNKQQNNSPMSSAHGIREENDAETRPYAWFLPSVGQQETHPPQHRLTEDLEEEEADCMLGSNNNNNFSIVSQDLLVDVEDLNVSYANIDPTFVSHHITRVRCTKIDPLLDAQRLLDATRWESNSARRSCPYCHKTFGLTKRRHHCRQCGLLVCDTCCPVRKESTLSRMGYVGEAVRLPELRICRECFRWCDKNLFLLLLYERYEEALAYAHENEDLCEGYLENNYIGRRILVHLFASGRYWQCAQLLRRVLGEEPALWEEWILAFLQKRALRALIPHLPQPTRQTHIDSAMYTTILCHLVQEDPEELVHSLKRWKYVDGAYDAAAVLCAIEGYLKVRRQQIVPPPATKQQQNQDDILAMYAEDFLSASVVFIMRAGIVLHGLVSTKERLLRSYVEHYYVFIPIEADSDGNNTTNNNNNKNNNTSHNGNGVSLNNNSYVHSLDMSLLSSGQEAAAAAPFQPEHLLVIDSYIEENDLWHVLLPPNSMLRTLVRRQRDVMTRLVLRSLHCNPKLRISDFVEQLAAYPHERLALLHALTLIEVSSTSKYHNQLVGLYVKYRPEGLLGFVKQRDLANINWKAAAELTRERRMFREYAYILGRTGNFVQALHTIARCLKDVRYGLEYIENVGDDDGSLKNLLFEHAKQSPILIGDVISASSDFSHLYNVSDFLKTIPDKNKLEVPRLRSRVMDVFHETGSDHTIMLSTVRAMQRSNFDMHCKAVAHAQAAISIDVDDDIPMFEETQDAADREAILNSQPPKGGIEAAAHCGYCLRPVPSRTGFLMSACGHVYHINCLAQIENVSTERATRAKGRSRENLLGGRRGGVPRLTAEQIRRLNDDDAYQYSVFITALEENTTDPTMALPYPICRHIFSYFTVLERTTLAGVSKSWHRMGLDAAYGPLIVREKHGDDPHGSGCVRVVDEPTHNQWNLYFRRYDMRYMEPTVRVSGDSLSSSLNFRSSDSLFRGNNVQCYWCSRGRARYHMQQLDMKAKNNKGKSGEGNTITINSGNNKGGASPTRGGTGLRPGHLSPGISPNNSPGASPVGSPRASSPRFRKVKRMMSS
eukprot:PhM_4_TR308/c0_g1_i1/m.13733